MSLLSEITFLVVDVETTGHDTKNNSIMDFAYIEVFDKEVIEEYESLVNPHQYIPPYISKMTGISGEMTFFAPDLNEVLLPKVAKFKGKNTAFVAHNVRFDWNFVKASYLRSGINLEELPLVCTLKLARKLLNKDIKKNVGGLASYFGIPMKRAHRAYDDAKATALVFIRLLEMLEEEYNIDNLEDLLKFQNANKKTKKVAEFNYKKIEDKIKALPNHSGVYYFKDKYGKIIYVGKAKNLKRRVSSYFGNGNLENRKIMKMLPNIQGFDYKETMSELGALLLEMKEIKHYKPKFNTLEKKLTVYPLIKLNLEYEFPIIEKVHTIEDDDAVYYGPFNSGQLVDDLITIIDKDFKLIKCGPNLKPKEGFRPCFKYHVKQCLAPCNFSQSKSEYFDEVEKVRQFLSSYSIDLIEEFEEERNAFSENLQFELAEKVNWKINEIKKVFARSNSIEPSINANNLVLLQIDSIEDKTILIQIFRNSLLIAEFVVGRKQDLNKIKSVIKETYQKELLNKKSYSLEEINEMRIITSWLNRVKSEASILYYEGNSSQFVVKFENAVKSFDFNTLEENDLQLDVI